MTLKTKETTTNYLVALHGLPRAGKDSIAANLRPYGFTRVAFADALYLEVEQTFGVSKKELMSHEWKTVPQAFLSIQCSDSPKYRALLESRGENFKTPRTSRFHLQQWGEYRKIHAHYYWLSAFHETALLVEDSIVCTDLRFSHHEFPFLKFFAKNTGREFKVIEVKREPEQSYTPHVSNIRLPQYMIDKTIINRDGHINSAFEDAQMYLELGM